MKKSTMIFLHILFFAILFYNVVGQENTKKSISTTDTVHLKEVIISEGFTIDTIAQTILFVLEKQPIRNEPCEYLDFIVLYDDFSGMIFEMGPIINIHDIYWAFHQDSIIFFSFSSRIYNKVKLLKESDQIANYLLTYGVRERIGSRAFGYDCLILDTSGYYWTYNKYSTKNSYLFKKEETLSKCKLDFYNRIIGKK
jgi:hypothetical protein